MNFDVDLDLTSHALFYRTFQYSPNAIALVSADGRCLAANPALCRLLNETEPNLKERAIAQLCHPDDGGVWAEFWQELTHDVQDESPHERSLRFLHREGDAIPVWVSVTRCSYEKNEALTCYIAHISACDPGRWQLYEERYRSLFDYHPDPMFVLSLDGYYMDVNPAFEKLAGYTREEIARMRLHYRTMIDTSEHGKVRDCLALVAQGAPQRFDIVGIDRWGQYQNLDVTVIPFVENGRITALQGISKNVTEQKKLWEHLCESQRQYELISSHSQDIIALCAPNGSIQYISPAVYTQLGYDPQELIGVPGQTLVHPEDCKRAFDSVATARSDETRHMLRKRHKQGYYIWYESSIKFIRDQHGDVCNIVAVARDISERMQAQEQLFHSEEKYRSLVEELPVAVFIHQAGRWVYANDTAVRLLEASAPEELLGRSVYEFLHPDYHAIVHNRIRMMEGGQALAPMKQKLMTVGGRPIDVEVFSFPTWFEGRFATRVMVRDITDAEKARELLEHSEKLSLVGQLAAGIAHEIRNPLTAIKGFIQLLKSNASDKPYYYDIISSEINRIEEIIGEMLVLSKPKEAQIRPQDIRPLIGHVATLIDAQAIMNNIVIVTEYEEDLPLLECDENQLKQVFINLLKNAVEAMPNGGKLTLQVAAEAGGRQIAVRVIDQGCGIPAEKLASIGQPFYTTKEQGTGLGMMVSMKIIENHDGTMSIASEEGQGTKIEIRLPVKARPKESPAYDEHHPPRVGD
ncbi:PAS domain-containing sensor histidine kinase [Paenibacillus oleatilyticus]|uniref:PAS domain-containing sensor histidine kinase n=1 Tax=Paenibacillus oleatilyticus TaxID=2594886 RepID=UPI001C1FA4E0|nr:PAS domain-containing sensor histidine kinase [Paenibacillus oleatilyticus]MBU7316323.1 PAS domain S-box protein [Paenibacillus oleatilyticus]